jgi:hypothetical protein
MPKMNARMMRGKTALEVAAELYARHMFLSATSSTYPSQLAQKKNNFRLS